LEKKIKKTKRESWNKKIKKKWKNAQNKLERKSTMDYCYNPHWFGCGGTVIPPHHLDIVNNDTKQDKIILRN
jgi:hypothetical protein